MNKIIHYATILSLALASASALAASINYTLTSGKDTITFSLPQQPTAAASCAFYGNCATFNGVAVNVDGTLYPNAQVNFYLSGADGGLTIFTNPTDATMLVNNDGNFAEQLFTGSVTSPALTAPITSYVLYQESYNSPLYNEQFSLTASVVPDLVVTTNQDDAGTASNCTAQSMPGTGQDASCSLRDALLEAGSLGSANISFDATAFSAGNTAAQNTINLSATLTIPPSTTINGPTTGSGAAQKNLVTLSGGGPASNFPVLTVNNGGADAILANLTITNGYATGSSGGISLDYGAAITLQNCTVTGNAGGFWIGYAGSVTLIQSTVSGNTNGAIVSVGQNLTVNASTISGNTGGAIVNVANGAVTITDSTISGNKTAQYGEGGAIRNTSGTLTVTRSTITANNADYLGGGISNNSGTVTISNSIVAGNSSNYQYADMYGSYTDGGGNLIGTDPSATSLINANLALLANYGGLTQTQLPQPGSAAICGGLSANVPSGVITDQRGLPRANSTYPGYSASDLCVDAGAVQTNYALAFTTEPPANPYFSVAISPAPAVTVTESGVVASAANSPVTFTDSAAVLTGTTTVNLTAGTATPSNLILSSAVSSDALTATLPLNSSSSLTAQSTSFEALTSPATLTSPAPGSTLTGSAATFTWSAGTGVTGYKLTVGDLSSGSSNLYNSGVLRNKTSASVGNLPMNGETLYVRLCSYMGSAWQCIDSTYTAAMPAAMSSPAPGAAFTGSSQSFTWAPVNGATGYTLWLGSTGVGSGNLFDGHTTATTLTATNLPANGETIYARLFTNFGGVSAYTDSTFTAVLPATLTMPTPGTTLTGSSQTFTWTPIAGATGYTLWLGSTGVGSGNLYDGHTTAATLTAANLPVNGGTIYARLYTSFNGVTAYTDSTFTAVSGATLSTPAPGATLSGSSQTFTWAPIAGASGYTLWLGSTAGAGNLYDGHTTTASLTATNLPVNGGTIYARLYTSFGGATAYTDSTFTAK